MIFYLFGLLLFLILGYGYSRDKYSQINLFSCTTLFLYFVFIFTFRNHTVGTDTIAYIQNFNTEFDGYEFGFRLINLILKKLHLSHFSLFFIISSITFILFSKSFYRENMYLLFPLLYIIMFVPSFNIQRQIFALSFAFYGIKLNNRNSFFLFIIGFFIHKSIMFYFLIYLMSRIVKVSQKFYYVFGVFLLFVSFSGKILDLLLVLIDFTPYAEYRWIVFNNVSFSVSVVLYIKLILYYMLFFYVDVINDSKKRSLYNILISCMIVAEVAVKMNPIFFRLQVLFSPVLLLGVECVLCKVHKEKSLKHKVYLCVLVGYTVFAFYLNLNMGVNQIIPYSLMNCYEL